MLNLSFVEGHPAGKIINEVYDENNCPGSGCPGSNIQRLIGLCHMFPHEAPELAGIS